MKLPWFSVVALSVNSGEQIDGTQIIEYQVMRQIKFDPKATPRIHAPYWLNNPPHVGHERLHPAVCRSYGLEAKPAAGGLIALNSDRAKRYNKSEIPNLKLTLVRGQIFSIRTGTPFNRGNPQIGSLISSWVTKLTRHSSQP
jgi:hypothetical protein